MNNLRRDALAYFLHALLSKFDTNLQVPLLLTMCSSGEHYFPIKLESHELERKEEFPLSSINNNDDDDNVLIHSHTILTTNNYNLMNEAV